jgi:carbonic anhydrase
VLAAAAAAQTVQTKESQSATTPEHALELLKAGNERFLYGKLMRHELVHQREATADGQYPFAAVLSCIDSRASSELIFDQGIGDIFNVRVAGNVVNDDVLASLEYATAVAGAKLILVVGHSHCGAVKGALDNVKLGHITGLVAKIQHVADDVAGDAERTSKNHELVEKVAEANVRRVTYLLLAESAVLRGLVEQKKLRIVGAMHDLKEGKVEFFE